MTLQETREAVKAARARGDTRGLHKAHKEAYAATHEALSWRPRKPLLARILARVWG